MKRTFGTALLLVLFALPSFASNKPHAVSFSGAVLVGSTQLPAGDYNVTWTGTGNDVQVTISAKGKPSVTAPAHIVNEKNVHAGVSTSKATGKAVLDEILFTDLTLTFPSGSTITGN